MASGELVLQQLRFDHGNVPLLDMTLILYGRCKFYRPQPQPLYLHVVDLGIHPAPHPQPSPSTLLPPACTKDAYTGELLMGGLHSSDLDGPMGLALRPRLIKIFAHERQDCKPASTSKNCGILRNSMGKCKSHRANNKSKLHHTCERQRLT